MSFLDAVILGIVEGLSEFLPISSTGHLILTAKFLGLEQTGFLPSFEVVIQLGAILAIVAMYWRKLFLNRAVMERIAIALLPAILIGGSLYPWIKSLFAMEAVVVAALFFGGVLIILFEWFHKEKPDAVDDLSTLPRRTAFFVGMFQALSVIPGVSRAGATILGGLALGMKRRATVEFSFLLAVPTMIAATVIDLAKNGAMFASSEWGLLSVGFMTAFLVAIIAVKFFLRFAESHTFIAFGVYRMLLAALFFLFIF
jgi:undecaprenyl-diphosphatase